MAPLALGRPAGSGGRSILFGRVWAAPRLREGPTESRSRLTASLPFADLPVSDGMMRVPVMPRHRAIVPLVIQNSNRDVTMTSLRNATASQRDIRSEPKAAVPRHLTPVRPGS